MASGGVSSSRLSFEPPISALRISASFCGSVGAGDAEGLPAFFGVGGSPLLGEVGVDDVLDNFCKEPKGDLTVELRFVIELRFVDGEDGNVVEGLLALLEEEEDEEEEEDDEEEEEANALCLLLDRLGDLGALELDRTWPVGLARADVGFGDVEVSRGEGLRIDAIPCGDEERFDNVSRSCCCMVAIDPAGLICDERTKTPYNGGHSKYLLPCTDPSFFPLG